jgi:hypothetical protein
MNVPTSPRPVSNPRRLGWATPDLKLFDQVHQHGLTGFSASANVLKGDPPTLTAVLLKLMGRQEATKPGFP